MKIFFLALLCCLAVSQSRAGDAAPSLARRQQVINSLLNHVTEPLHCPDLMAYAADFDPVADLSLYSDGGKAAQHLIDELKDHRLLERQHWFSLFNTRHREEALMLFEVLLTSKTWETVVQNAAYFRERVNEGEFVYALFAAVIHSEAGNGIILPPLYEVTPHLFTNSEIISKAYSAQMTQTKGNFKMEFTGSQKNPEQRVAYFGEDIGLNVHHVTWHLDFPFWWEDSYGYHLDRKGELFFWVHHQLTVRFDAERLSNHLDPVDALYWDKPIVEGFAPHTTYKYGGEFPSRPDNVNFEDVDGVIRVRDMIIHETRIRDAIAHGYIMDRDGDHIDIKNNKGISLLGDIIESSLYSPNVKYYGSLHNEAHILLGRQADPHGKYNLPPSVMEHFETATRDPAFFRLHKYMDNIFKEHKHSLPPYTKEDIVFPGILLKSIRVEGGFETFFEDFEFDISSAVDSHEGLEDVELKATVSRLNHKPFTLELEIVNNNEATKDAVVRVFLSPDVDVRIASDALFDINEDRWQMIELDKFWTKLGPGVNHIVRPSTDSSVTALDNPSFHTLIEKANAAVESGSSLGLEAYERSCGIPNRLLLPKGNVNGLPCEVIVVVTDGSDDEHQYDEGMDKSHAQCGVHGQKYPDSKPMGFPFDRRIEDLLVFVDNPNINYIQEKITFKP